MYCSNCGAKIDNNIRYCPNCGAQQSDSAFGPSGKTMKLTCKQCHGVLQYSIDNPVLICPYCGSKELILENDAVTIERIRSRTYKEVQFEKNKTLKEIERLKNERIDREREEERRRSFQKSIFCKIVIIFTVICALMAASGFSNYEPIGGIVAVIQTILLILTFLTGIGFIKERIRGQQYVLFIVACLLIGLFIWGINEGSNLASRLELHARNRAVAAKTFVWPDEGLITKLPEPKSHKGVIPNNSDTYANAFVYALTVDDFNEYLSECIELGFILDPTRDENSYLAHNDENTKISLFYDGTESCMHITVTAVPPMIERKWPTYGMAKKIPVPEYSKCNITSETSNRFAVQIADYSLDAYNAYVDKCTDMGFTKDIWRTESYFSALNENGDRVSVQYDAALELITIEVYNYNRKE